MKRTTKNHLGLISALAISLVVIGATSYEILHKHARDQVINQASVLMEAALAMRKYTITEIKPLLALQNKRNFLPQSVPSYAATKNFDALRESHSEYRYKEATLNPTNLRDRATDWEADIIQEFRNDKNKEHMTLVRSTPSGMMLYYARPIQIKNEACLTCHGMIEDAPKTMIDLYGPANGFGWKMDEVVGSQIVSVPFALAVNNANETFSVLMGLVAGIFLILYLVLIFLLKPMFFEQPVAQTAVAVHTTQENPVTQIAATAEVIPEITGSSAAQQPGETPDPVAVQENVVTQTQPIGEGMAATPEQPVTQNAVTQGHDSVESRNLTRPKQIVPSSDPKVLAENPARGFRYDLRDFKDFDDTQGEQSISLQKMYKNNKNTLTDILADETLGIEEAITELKLSKKVESEKS